MSDQVVKERIEHQALNRCHSGTLIQHKMAYQAHPLNGQRSLLAVLDWPLRRLSRLNPEQENPQHTSC